MAKHENHEVSSPLAEGNPPLPIPNTGTKTPTQTSISSNAANAPNPPPQNGNYVVPVSSSELRPIASNPLGPGTSKPAHPTSVVDIVQLAGSAAEAGQKADAALTGGNELAAVAGGVDSLLAGKAARIVSGLQARITKLESDNRALEGFVVKFKDLVVEQKGYIGALVDLARAQGAHFDAQLEALRREA